MKTKPWFGIGIGIGGCALLAAVAALVAGCGGGVGEGGTGNGYTQGAITGFGSIFVDDVRFEDSAATVFDADGERRSRDDLRLGMRVEVDSDAITAGSGGPSATATRIRFASDLRGPVASVDAASGVFTMLGQTVKIDAATVFDERLRGGLAAISAGHVLEVHAGFDPGSGRYRATRVEPASATAGLSLRGIVSSLDAASKRFRIGSADYDYSGAGGVPASLADGSPVRLSLPRSAPSNGRWSVSSFAAGVNAPAEGHEARVRGFVTSFVSMQKFSVEGHPVDATGVSLPDGVALGPGVRVEVEGSIDGGVLRASRVSVRGDRQEEQQAFQLDGTVASVDAAGRTFRLRGVTVGFGHAAMRIEGGSLADIVPGRKVQVRGVLSGDGTWLDATLIAFEH
jgi:Domain of unknown function (DUF5666)